MKTSRSGLRLAVEGTSFELWEAISAPIFDGESDSKVPADSANSLATRTLGIQLHEIVKGIPDRETMNPGTTASEKASADG